MGVFKCDCGHVGQHVLEKVRNGGCASCGCTRARNAKEAATKHGYALEDRSKRPPEYRAWGDMRSRCFGRSEDSKYYGARGITVCEEWSSFPQFYADMGPRPSPQHSLDRIDVNGSYCPENCRWATRVQQMRNVRNNIRFTFYGREKLLVEWAEISQVNPKVIYSRLYAGWPPKYAVWAAPGSYRGTQPKPWKQKETE